MGELLQAICALRIGDSWAREGEHYLALVQPSQFDTFRCQYCNMLFLDQSYH